MKMDFLYENQANDQFQRNRFEDACSFFLERQGSFFSKPIVSAQ